jgi:vancomycin permeability regulator SanA
MMPTKKVKRFPIWFRRLSFTLSCSIAVVAAAPIVATVYVNLVTSSDRYSELTKVPKEDLAIVFGAGLSADGTPSPMLSDRVEAAVELYNRGKVHKLLMTGDNSQISYNEVVAMKLLAHHLGVPNQSVFLDYAGFSTYESCYRTHKVFDLHQAVLITQSYHLPRAVYTCRQLGVQAIGLGTQDLEIYGLRGMIPYLIREMLANLKALSEVHITRPRPTFL